MAERHPMDRFNSIKAVAQANVQKLLCDLPILGALKNLASHIEQMEASESGSHDGEEIQRMFLVNILNYGFEQKFYFKVRIGHFMHSI